MKSGMIGTFILMFICGILVYLGYLKPAHETIKLYPWIKYSPFYFVGLSLLLTVTGSAFHYLDQRTVGRFLLNLGHIILLIFFSSLCFLAISEFVLTRNYFNFALFILGVFIVVKEVATYKIRNFPLGLLAMEVIEKHK